MKAVVYSPDEAREEMKAVVYSPEEAREEMKAVEWIHKNTNQWKVYVPQFKNNFWCTNT